MIGKDEFRFMKTSTEDYRDHEIKFTETADGCVADVYTSASPDKIRRFKGKTKDHARKQAHAYIDARVS
jgi:hypothetical protein